MRTLVPLVFLVAACTAPVYDYPAPDAPLFQIYPSEDVPLEDSALSAFRAYATANPGVVGLTGDAETALAELTPAGPTFINKDIGIVRLAQSYRGVPVYKSRSDITMVVTGGTQVTALRGRLIDQNEEYAGFDDRLATPQARLALAGHWAAQAEPGEGDLLGPVRVVALPNLRQIAYAGEFQEPLFTSSRSIVGTVLVGADDGTFIAIEDRPAEARVLAPEIDDDPRNLNLVFRDGLPSKTLGNTIDFSQHPEIDCTPIGWRPIRLGDAQRHAVLSFEGGAGEAFAHFESAECTTDTDIADFAGGSPGVVNTLNDQLYAQDVFVKSRLAMALIDPLMGELFSHGSEHPYSWDHHPTTPEIIHRAAFVNVVDASSDWFMDNPGVFKVAKISEADAAAVDIPVPHSLLFHCLNGQGDPADCDDAGVEGPFSYIPLVGSRAAPPFQSRTLFHEIGHYYDNFNAYGISGDNGEIIPQLFSLYLHRRIYDLDYRITGNATVQCSLSALVGHSAGVVVHPDCITDLDQISTAIDFDGPYTARSFTQGYWSLLNAASCTVTNQNLTCDISNAASDEYPDRWMEALLFALQTGNDLEPVEIWDAMSMFIAANYPQDNQRLATVRALHGLD